MWSLMTHAASLRYRRGLVGGGSDAEKQCEMVMRQTAPGWVFWKGKADSHRRLCWGVAGLVSASWVRQ